MMDNFIMIYYWLLDDGDYKLSVEQLNLYGLLRAGYSSFLGYTGTSIALLAQGMGYSNDTNTSRRTNNIQKLLNALFEMNVIQLAYDGELKSNTLLKVTFPSVGTGFVALPPEIFAMASTPDEFKVLVTLHRFKGFERSKDNWSSYLGYSSKNTGFSIISEMEENGKIYCVEGEKYLENGKIKQHPTKWYIKYDQELSIAATETIVVNEAKEATKVVPSSIAVKVEPQKDLGNWDNMNTSAFIDEREIEIYVKHMDDPEFMEIVKRKLEITNEKARRQIEKKIKEAVDKKYREKNKNAIIIGDETISVDGSNIDRYRQHLIDHFYDPKKGDGVRVSVYDRSNKKKGAVSLKAMAARYDYDDLSLEIIEYTVDTYISLVKKGNEIDDLVFSITKQGIQGVFRL